MGTLMTIEVQESTSVGKSFMRTTSCSQETGAVTLSLIRSEQGKLSGDRTTI